LKIELKIQVAYLLFEIDRYLISIVYFAVKGLIAYNKNKFDIQANSSFIRFSY